MLAQPWIAGAAWLATLSCLLNLCSQPLAAADAANVPLAGCKSIRDFGVLPTNTPAANQAALQRAMDFNAARARPISCARVRLFPEPYPAKGQNGK